MKKFKIKNIWLVKLYIYHKVFNQIDVMLPKDINDLEINIALFVTFILPILIMLALIIITIL